MIYDIHHVRCENDLKARAEYFTLKQPVHQAGGALWLSLGFGVGESVVLVALPPVELTGDLAERFAESVPVTHLDPTAFGSLDPEFMPLYVDPIPAPVVPVTAEQPQETPADEQSEAGAR